MLELSDLAALKALKPFDATLAIKTRMKANTTIFVALLLLDYRQEHPTITTPIMNNGDCDEDSLSAGPLAGWLAG